MRATSALEGRRRLAAAGSITLSIVALAGCGGSTTSSQSRTEAPRAHSAATTSEAPEGQAAGGASVVTVEVAPLGHILGNVEGKTLYTFAPDKRSKVTCVGSCALVWPPLKLPSGATPVGKGEVKTSLLSSTPDPEGGQVVTYAGWPLYRYVGDTKAAIARGQALNLNGGLWYVIAPSGQVITKAP